MTREWTIQLGVTPEQYPDLAEDGWRLCDPVARHGSRFLAVEKEVESDAAGNASE